jgi:hypothetical protein
VIGLGIVDPKYGGYDPRRWNKGEARCSTWIDRDETSFIRKSESAGRTTHRSIGSTQARTLMMPKSDPVPLSRFA